MDNTWADMRRPVPETNNGRHDSMSWPGGFLFPVIFFSTQYKVPSPYLDFLVT